MNETNMAETLAEMLESDVDNLIVSVQTFEEAGAITKNNGLIVRTTDNSEFQIMVVKVR